MHTPIRGMAVRLAMAGLLLVFAAIGTARGENRPGAARRPESAGAGNPPAAQSDDSLAAQAADCRKTLAALAPPPGDIAPALLQTLRNKSVGYNLTDDLAGLWEATARVDDFAKVGPRGYQAALRISRGFIAVAPPPEGASRAPPLPAALLARAGAVTANETVEPDALAEAARRIHATGKSFAIAPMGSLLLQWGPEKVAQLAAHADIFTIQAERWLEEDASPDKANFIGNVLMFSAAIRKGNHRCRIFIEIGRRIDRGGGTADQWIHALALVAAKDPTCFDGIYPFISRQETDDPAQSFGALRQMLAWLRPPAPPTARIRALHYAAVKDVIKDGDIVFAVATRGLPRGAAVGLRPDDAGGGPQGGAPPRGPLPQPVWLPEKFEQALAALKEVQDKRVVKAIVLSSLEDLKANLEKIPADVAWIDYNSEPGMTPAGELDDIVAGVRQFAEIVRKSGRKVAWAPTNVMLRADEEKFLCFATHVDGMALQHQKVLEYEGLNQFVSLTKDRAAKIRRANPACAVVVQVVIGRGKTEDLVAGLKAVAPVIEGMSVFTMQDTQAAAAIYKAVRGP